MKLKTEKQPMEKEGGDIEYATANTHYLYLITVYPYERWTSTSRYLELNDSNNKSHRANVYNEKHSLTYTHTKPHTQTQP